LPLLAIILIKCVDIERTPGEGGQEDGRTFDRPLKLFCTSLLFLVFLETTFCETIQDKGMGKCKRKAAKASIYGRKRRKKRRGD
jgi:hypothetical protein